MGSGKNGTFDIHPDFNQWAILFTAENINIKAPNFIYRYFRFFRCKTKEFLLATENFFTNNVRCQDDTFKGLLR